MLLFSGLRPRDPDTSFQRLRKRAAMGAGAWYCFHSQRLADQESSQWQYLRYSYQDLEIRTIDDNDENGNGSCSA